MVTILMVLQNTLYQIYETKKNKFYTSNFFITIDLSIEQLDQIEYLLNDYFLDCNDRRKIKADLYADEILLFAKSKIKGFSIIKYFERIWIIEITGEHIKHSLTIYNDLYAKDTRIVNHESSF